MQMKEDFSLFRFFCRGLLKGVLSTPFFRLLIGKKLAKITVNSGYPCPFMALWKISIIHVQGEVQQQP